MAANIRRSFYRPDGELTDELVLNVLSLVGETPAEEVAASWTEFERLIVVDWALREHYSASDNPTQRRPRPRGLLGAR